MHRDYFIFCLLGISSCYLVGIAAREAIVGGQLVEQYDFRYQAAIFIDNDTLPICGGGIIGERTIISAANCVLKPYNNGELIGASISVVVGTYDLSVAGMVVQVEKVFLPKECNPHIPHCIEDIAVLRLEKELQIQKHNLRQLKLARHSVHDFYKNKTARISGFGWDKVDEDNKHLGKRSDSRLRFASVDVLSENECMHHHPTLNLTERHLCARVKQLDGIRRGACVGDVGGPLVHAKAGSTVIGVLSATIVGCDERESSGVYTSVAHYMELIFFARQNVAHPNVHILETTKQ